jgi:hypothetical protein
VSDGFVALCVLTQPPASRAVSDELPLEPEFAVCYLRNRTTHIHFRPSLPESSTIEEQLGALSHLLEVNRPAFVRYRSATPFHVAIEWHYETQFDLTIDASIVAVLAGLRAAIDIDLFWINDPRLSTAKTQTRRTTPRVACLLAFQMPQEWKYLMVGSKWVDLSDERSAARQSLRRSNSRWSVGSAGQGLTFRSIHCERWQGTNRHYASECDPPDSSNPCSACILLSQTTLHADPSPQIEGGVGRFSFQSTPARTPAAPSPSRPASS